MRYASRIKTIGFLFVLPVMLYFAVFSFYPILNAFVGSFFKYNMFQVRAFTGISNYRVIFTSAPFLTSLKATLIYTVGYCLIVWTLSFMLALLLKARFLFRDSFKFVFFIPMVISIIVVSLTWYAIFMPSGLMNNLLHTMKFEWLTSTKLAIWTIIAVSVWKWSGFYVIVFLAGLNNIPDEYYDAARIDGATTFGVFRFITIPLLRPTITFVVLIALAGSVKVLEPMYIITRGGPVDSTKVVALKIYEEAFKSFNIGRASAMSMILFFLIMIFTIVQLRLFDIKD